MPTPIVAETETAPVCTLSPQDVVGLVDQLAAFHAQFASAFARADQAEWAHTYLQGLLGDCPRKSIEPMALALGVNIRAMQHFISHSPWTTAPVLARHHSLLAQTLGSDDGIYLVDESGVVKQGHDSVGVAPQ